MKYIALADKLKENKENLSSAFHIAIEELRTKILHTDDETTQISRQTVSISVLRYHATMGVESIH